MDIQNIVIKNRPGLKLVIQVDTPENPTDLVFVAHGRGGFKEQKHIQAFAEAFLENNFRVVRFDATNALGKSGGDIMNVTVTSYLEDLEDVISWARNQPWFQKPFGLCGHSLGAMSAALYAEANPDELLCLAPISVTINYELLKQTQKEEYWDDWRTKGYVEEASKSKPGMVMRIGWGLMEDIKKHDLLKGANKLTMPVLLMAGTNDKDTPYSQQEVLFAAIPGSKKKLVKVKNADHSFRDSGDDAQKLEEVKGIICAWLKAVVSTNSS